MFNHFLPSLPHCSKVSLCRIDSICMAVSLALVDSLSSPKVQSFCFCLLSIRGKDDGGPHSESPRFVPKDSAMAMAMAGGL